MAAEWGHSHRMLERPITQDHCPPGDAQLLTLRSNTNVPGPLPHPRSSAQGVRHFPSGKRHLSSALALLRLLPTQSYYYSQPVSHPSWGWQTQLPQPGHTQKHKDDLDLSLLHSPSCFSVLFLSPPPKSNTTKKTNSDREREN